MCSVRSKRDSVPDQGASGQGPASNSARRAAKLGDELAQIGGIEHWRDDECVDNLMAIYEYETPRARWEAEAEAGETVMTRASYTLNSMNRS